MKRINVYRVHVLHVIMSDDIEMGVNIEFDYRPRC
jgi:hypothetical protein